jgi:hypothetical protein
MKFARTVFRIAGIWGFLLLTPMFFMLETISRQFPPPVTHPDLYYGFLSVTIVWQLAFLIIATDPVRYRPLMVAAMFEKFVFIVAMVILYATGQVVLGQLFSVVPDFILGILFVLAFIKTPRQS